MSPEQRLTRQQRRALERESKKTKGRLDKADHTQQLEQQKAIIEQEIQRRNIAPNKRERLLWQAPFELQPLKLSRREIAANKMNTMLTLATNSDNPYAQEAINRVRRLIEDKRARAVVLDRMEGLLMGAEASRTESDIEFRLNISAEAAAIVPHPFLLAVGYVHEVEHLADMDEFDKNLPQTLSIDERYDAHAQRYHDLPTYHAMEARANATMSEMLIYHFGMVGLPQYVPSTYYRVVSSYVEAGCDPQSNSWQNTMLALDAEGLATRF